MHVETGSVRRTEEAQGRAPAHRRAGRIAPFLSALLAVAVLMSAGRARAQSGLTAAGTINSKITHKAGISLVFNTNASGVPLGASGTFAVTLDFGNISRFGVLAAGIARTATASDYTVSTPFDVNVTLAGGTSASYNLTAALSAPSGVYTFSFDAVPLSTTTATVVTNDPNYSTNRTHLLYLTVPLASAEGTVSNTINVTAVAN